MCAIGLSMEAMGFEWQLRPPFTLKHAAENYACHAKDVPYNVAFIEPRGSPRRAPRALPVQ